MTGYTLHEWLRLLVRQLLTMKSTSVSGDDVKKALMKHGNLPEEESDLIVGIYLAFNPSGDDDSDAAAMFDAITKEFKSRGILPEKEEAEEIIDWAAKRLLEYSDEPNMSDRELEHRFRYYLPTATQEQIRAILDIYSAIRDGKIKDKDNVTQALRQRFGSKEEAQLAPQSTLGEESFDEWIKNLANILVLNKYISNPVEIVRHQLSQRGFQQQQIEVIASIYSNFTPIGSADAERREDDIKEVSARLKERLKEKAAPKEPKKITPDVIGEALKNSKDWIYKEGWVAATAHMLVGAKYDGVLDSELFRVLTGLTDFPRIPAHAVFKAYTAFRPSEKREEDIRELAALLDSGLKSEATPSDITAEINKMRAEGLHLRIKDVQEFAKELRRRLHG